MKQLLYILIILSLSLASCKKAGERTCWKGQGNSDSLVLGLDSINSFRLMKDIKYNLYESDEKKMVVKGGENMIQQIGLEYDANELTVSNRNKCHFLRSGERSIEVDIFYPTYSEMYIEASDSVVFQDTIHSNIQIEMRNGGGSLVLNVANNSTKIVVSLGTADYTIAGQTNYAELKVQNNGFGDASGLIANSLFAFQNSTGDLYVNFESADALVLIEGTGDVFYRGIATQIDLQGKGSGKLLEY
jgi:Putative auto-transporter adhesin, head GIN domain